jgi:hypothetical protein
MTADHRDPSGRSSSPRSVPVAGAGTPTGGNRISAVCGFCKATIKDVYFHIDGKVACVRCKAKVDAREAKREGPARRLITLGLAACGGLVGAGLFYLLRATTGRDLAVVSIVSGALVGLGVRFGSLRRGAAGDRALAIGMAWAAIAVTWIPFVRHGGFWPPAPAAAIAAPATPDSTAAATPADTGANVPDSAAAADSAAMASTAPLAASPAPPATPHLGLGRAAAEVAGAPVLAVLASPLALLCNLVALVAAFLLTRGEAPHITGPFRLGYGLRNTPVRGTPVPPA